MARFAALSKWLLRSQKSISRKGANEKKGAKGFILHMQGKAQRSKEKTQIVMMIKLPFGQTGFTLVTKRRS